MTEQTALDCVLGFVRAIEAGGGAAEVDAFLADDFKLVEAPHLLAPEGSTRSRDQVLAGADQSRTVVEGQRFDVRRTTCEGGRVVLEVDWSATLLMDLRYWDAGEVIQARTTSVFEVRDGRIASQDSYDCYFTNGSPPE
ncbi:nuclear transport factor 2 family protein [Arthrobacter sp. 24S4-2]|uniref:nuclear transport factor 2 family protein n=1 Tax=Arthrobacter sp. 24S4-2 TaxID=2575374 RepID=UPI0010C7876A|nr:nuclear transport factor 2 family protein [Arthrobacter sp. 24S4-2]QCO98667.1 nuclear transport factor 2 family protein [Arthrobacter sp. 24S4-2]